MDTRPLIFLGGSVVALLAVAMILGPNPTLGAILIALFVIAVAWSYYVDQIRRK